ncbi:MAG TPA: sugar ABC transporter permease [Acidothermaceae bacterium]
MTATAAAPHAAGTVRPTLRHRLAERGVDRTLLLLLPAVVILGLLFCYPFIYGLGLSLQPLKGGGAFADYHRFFRDPFFRDTVWLTLKLGLPAALISVTASVPVAYKLRRPFRGKRILTTLLVVPITLGTVLTAEGLLDFLGPSGWFNRVLIGAHLINQPLRLVHNYWGVLASLIITGFPFAFLLTLSYLSGIDPSLEQAAATLGADWKARIRYITLPLLLPGLAVTFCLSFVLAFSVFPSAQLVGDPNGTTHVMSVEAYRQAFEQFDFPMGSTIAMVMAFVMLIVVGVVMAMRTLFYRGSTGGKG